MGDTNNSENKTNKLVTFTGKTNTETTAQTNNSATQKTIQEKTSTSTETKKGETTKKLPGIKHSVNYSFAGDSLTKSIKSSFPKEMIPTKITGYFILSLFLLALILGLIQFPLGKMLSGNVDITISVGYPWPFFVMELTDPTASPLRIGGLLLDILLYTIISYMIEVAFNFFMTSPFMRSQKEKSVMPKWFRNLGEKIRKKKGITEEPYKTPEPEPTPKPIEEQTKKEETTNKQEETKEEKTTQETNQETNDNNNNNNNAGNYNVPYRSI